MERDLQGNLLAWKQQPDRMPLLLRGARQVGKTYLITQFGEEHFTHFVLINFELQPEYIDCFQSLDPQKILTAINALRRQKIIPGKTLLFLDEIQECPNAIMSLRYFKELLPELHVIGAGSLLEFTMNNADFRMPVGRVQSFYLKPLSFKEYLMAKQADNMLDYLSEINLDSEINPAITKTLEQHLRDYFLIGGMPAIIKHAIKHQDLEQCQIMRISLLNTYRSDFGKYATTANHKYLQRIFEQTPKLIGKHFKYSYVDPHMQSRELKPALSNLMDAGLLYPIYCSKASGLPLNTLINEKKFKLLFLDIGLVKASSLLGAEILLSEDIVLLNQGALAEQFVGQELLAHFPAYLPGELYYWEREKKGGTAEVDYIINANETIIPIEVKSGKTGTLRSLHYFLDNKKSPFGIRLSLHPLSFNNRVLSIPLYMLHELKRIVGEIL